MTEETIKGWFTEEYDYERPSRGQVREGVVLTVGEQGVTVDVGLKRDGFVPETDIERLEREEDEDLGLEPGKEVTARVVRAVDREGRLVLSLYQALSEQDWDRAEELLESKDVWEGEVIGYNRGGLIVKFGRIRGFVPGSHLWTPKKRHLSTEQRKELFQEYMGEELTLKVIEVDRKKRRLILSERLARRKMRRKRMKELLDELMEGQVVEGTVRRLTDFGAFVDLGGANGLIHISELAWRYIRHPSEVLDPGDKVKVYILRLDRERKRIALSLKRLQPSPWELVDETYSEGQLVQGTVTSITDFGAFVVLDIGVDGLVHISELSDPQPDHPRDVVQPGDDLVLRILNIDSFRHRIGLSLRRVPDQERERWLAARAAEREEAEEEAEQEEAQEETEQQEAQEISAGKAPSSSNGKVNAEQADATGTVEVDEPEVVENAVEAIAF